MFSARSLLTALLALLAGAWIPAVAAQEPKPEVGSASKPTEDKTKDTDSDADEEEKEDKTPLVIRGGNIHIGDGSVLRRATVLVEKGKIKAVGHDLEIPEDAETIDATGMVVSPGFVIPKVSGAFGTGSASAGMVDSLNPFNPSIKRGLASGITSFMTTGNGGSSTPRGYSRLIKLCPEDLDGMASGPEKTIVSMRVPLAPADLRKLEKLVADTRAFIAARKNAPKNPPKPTKKASKPKEGAKPSGKPSPTRGKPTKPTGPKPPSGSGDLIRVLERDAILWISSRSGFDDASLNQALRIARLLDVGVVLDQPVTAWAVADEIAATNSMVLLNPRARVTPNPSRPDTTGSNIASAAILHAVGIPVAVTCPSGGFGGGPVMGTGGLMGSDLNTPHIDAAYAVRGGMPNRAALRTLTLDSARLLGVDDRVGSIEPGKDADILLLDGDPLHYKSLVETAIVNGQVVYRRAEEPFYAHIKR